jgi:hypothetical protein
MADLIYEVHLTADEPPIESQYADFYDSGVWVDRDDGREFYPYERVAKVKEVPADGNDGVEPADVE